MITKAYVVKQSTTSPNKYVVRIPVFNAVKDAIHATPDSELSEATVICSPASSNILHSGDCVYVGFENNDYNQPVILGHLFAESINNTPIDIAFRKLTVNEDASEVSLTKNTTIGNVKPSNIECLTGCSVNIRDTFYNMKYFFTETSDATSNPQNIFTGTQWELVLDANDTPVVTDFGAYVWHRTQ